jgi:hypothetical protein
MTVYIMSSKNIEPDKVNALRRTVFEMLSLAGLDVDVRSAAEGNSQAIRAYVKVLEKLNAPVYGLLEVSITDGTFPEHFEGALRPYAYWMEIPESKAREG